MKYGVFTVTTPEYNLQETVTVLKELGYDGVEWRVSNPVPEKKPADYTYERRYWSYNTSTLDINRIEEGAVEAKILCDRAGLEIYSLTTYLKPADIQTVERVLKAAAQIQCKNIRVFPPNYDGTENYRQLFERTITEVQKVEVLAARYGVRVNLEIHMGNIIPSASAAYRLVSNFDPEYIGIIHDAGNMVHEGFENYRLGLELLGQYLAYVHIKNAVWIPDKTDIDGTELHEYTRWKPVWAPYRKGFANLSGLISVLKDMGYRGYISVEDFSNEMETYDKLRDNLRFLKSIEGGNVND
ncbi:MAG TPA: sugar phosphate isomerase/epimerase family protein [Bacillota bacterium]|nr:sugar phosphate isomerase/epimerase family protein [Bacillota bacterium]